MSDRDVPWGDFYNARDLGGLTTTDGVTTADDVLAAVQDLDVPPHLVGAGVTSSDVDSLRDRLRG